MELSWAAMSGYAEITSPSPQVPLRIAPREVPQDPSAEVLEQLLEELIEKYKDPSFKQDVARVQAECLKAGVPYMAAWAKVVLKYQAPILQKHGLPPNPEGVDLMKHAVARRISEGGSRLETLANEARRILGIQPMPDRSPSCEVALSRMVDATVAKLDGGIGDELAKSCRQSLKALVQKGTISTTMFSFLEDIFAEGSAPVLSVLSFITMAKLGLSVRMLTGPEQPLEVPTIEAPQPTVFFQNFVMSNRPAILKNVFRQQTFAPLETFTDFTFLRQLCGHRRVLTKNLAYNDSEGRPVFVTDPELRLPFEAFLDRVEEHERGSCIGVPFYLGKVPLKIELPELAQEIERAETCPQRIYGSCFGKLNPDGVFTYMGCGRNTTSVHFDMRENLLLCLNGTKRLWLFPPRDACNLYPVFTQSMSDFSRSAAPPFTCFDEMSAEFQEKYPLLRKSQHVEVNLSAGDMLYLPSCWWHCVEGSQDRNMILNWWFDWHPDKSKAAFAE